MTTTFLSSKRRRVAFVLLAFAFALSATLTSAQTTAPPPSGCEICRDKQDCSKAFMNQPGQFCGNWLDPSNTRRACCCAVQDTCVRETTSSCKCQAGKKKNAPVATNNSSEKKKDDGNDKKKIWYIIGIIVFAGLVGLLVFMYCRSKRNDDDESYNDYPAQQQQPEVVVQKTYVQEAPQYAAAPVYAAPQPHYAAPQPQYVAAQPQYVAAQPQYASAPSHGYSQQSPRRGGGGFNGAGVAVGAAAGLVGGMLLGHAIADAGDSGDRGNDDMGTYAGDF